MADYEVASTFRKLSDDISQFSSANPSFEYVEDRQNSENIDSNFLQNELPDIDWQIVVELRREVSNEIAKETKRWEQKHKMLLPDLDRRLMGQAVITNIVHDYAEQLNLKGEALWSLDLENHYIKSVANATFGYGRLQPLLDIPDAENIEITGWDCVRVQYGDGRRDTHLPVADSDEELVETIRFLGETAKPSRPFDDAHPMMTIALGNKFRLHAIGFGLSYRPTITIRQHILTDVTLRRLSEGGMFPTKVARLLNSAVLARKSIVISGDQGAGKTTLLRGLISAIPENERFGTLETDYELLTHLQPKRRNMLALQAKIGFGEYRDGKTIGEYSVADLIPEALRQNLSRLIIGEVRGNEAGAMFEAMQSGAGTFSTTHSRSALAAIDRLASRVAQSNVMTIDEAYRQIALNIDFLIHVTLEDNTWRAGARKRFISEIRVFTGSLESGRPTTHLVYRAMDSAAEIFSVPSSLANEFAKFDNVWQSL